MKQYFIKTTLVVIFIFSNFIVLFSQTNKLSLSLAYETANFTNNQYKPYLLREGNNTPVFKVGIDYKLSRVFYLGGYLNYSRFANPESYTSSYIVNGVEEEHEWFGFNKSNAFGIGTNLNIQLLPLFVERDLRLDIYSKIQLGVLYNNTANNQYIESGFSAEYGVGMGLCYNISKKFGLYGEYVFGDFYNGNKDKMTFGIKIKL